MQVFQTVLSMLLKYVSVTIIIKAFTTNTNNQPSTGSCDLSSPRAHVFLLQLLDPLFAQEKVGKLACNHHGEPCAFGVIIVLYPQVTCL